ncbi:hypothetical protein HAX54_052705, partial [Datura stramonium]|nr:hypothetical protein [Datura stramonium]
VIILRTGYSYLTGGGEHDFESVFIFLLEYIGEKIAKEEEEDYADIPDIGETEVSPTRSNMEKEERGSRGF